MSQARVKFESTLNGEVKFRKYRCNRIESARDLQGSPCKEELKNKSREMQSQNKGPYTVYILVQNITVDGN